MKLSVTSKHLTQSVDIYTIAKKSFTSIQTDKFVYKPGDLVRFRLFILDAHGKGFHTENSILDVRVFNPAGEELYKWLEERYEAKVYSLSYQLSEYSRIGMFSICAKLTKQIDHSIGQNEEESTDDHCQTFKVEKYVLPLFDIKLSQKNRVAHNEEIRIKVSAEYTFGKLVKGSATVTGSAYVLEKKSKSQSNPMILKTATKTLPVDSMRVFAFSPSKDFNLVDKKKSYFIEFKVQFTEEHTSNTFDKNATVFITRNEIKLIKLEPQSKYFKPNQERFLLTASLIDFHDKVIINGDYSPKLELTVYFPYGISDPIRHSHTKMKNGLYEFNIPFPENMRKDKKISIKVQVENNIQHLIVKPSRASASSNSLQITYDRNNLKVGDKATLTVKGDGQNSWHDTQMYVAYVNNRGKTNILKVGLDKNEIYKDKFVFDFVVQRWMMPCLNMIFFYRHPRKNEIIFDAIKIPIDASPVNKLKVDLPNKETYEPGEDLSMRFFTYDNATGTSLHVTGVDKGVELMGRSNELSIENYINEIVKLNKQINTTKLKVNGEHDDRYSDIGEYNLFFMTNAFENFTIDQTNKAGVQIGDKTLGEKTDDEILIEDSYEHELFFSDLRENFPETFVYFDKDNVKDGFTTSKRIPDTISSFKLKAFTFNPEKGIAISNEDRSSITVFKKFFIKINLPYSIHVGEVLKVDVVVYNYMDTSVETNVKIAVNETQMSLVGMEQYDGNCKVFQLKKAINIKQLKIEKNSAESTYFYIQANLHGRLDINFEAITDVGEKDLVRRELLVEPEGILITKTIPFAFPIISRSSRKYPLANIQENIPNEGVYSDTIYVEMKIYGNLLGNALYPAEKLM